VNGAVDEFFSGACFAQYENGCVRRRHGLNTLQDGFKSRSLADHVADVVVKADLVFEVQLFDREPLDLQVGALLQAHRLAR